MMPAIVATIAAASAQDEGGFDAHGFRFASADADPRSPIGFVRPRDEDDLAGSLAAAFEYATRPLVFDTGEGPETVMLEDLVVANLAAGLVPVAPLRLGVTAPFFLASQGGGETHTTAMGDVRLSALAVPLEPEAGGFGLGLLAALDLPTGDPATYRGTDGIAGLVALAGTVEGGPLTVSFQAGGRAAPNTVPDERPAPTIGGDTFEGQLAFAGLAGAHTGIGVEGRMSVPFDPAVREAIGTAAEAMGTLRFVTTGGGHVLAGVGVGIGEGAGASPVRFVFGGGFGTSSNAGVADADGDGVADGRDACPDGAETVNGFADEDACPDALPQVEFVVVAGGVALEDAELEAMGPTGESVVGVGRVVATGMPGESVHVKVRAGDCRTGETQARFPPEGTATVQVEVVAQRGEVAVSVTDTAGRPLEGAMVRYLTTEEACAPADATLNAGRGTHAIGVGQVTLFVTAPGYDVQQFDLEVTQVERQAVDAVLNPTQVTRRGSQVNLAEPIVFLPESAIVDEVSTPLLQQLATVILTEDLRDIRILAWGDGSSSRRIAEARGEAVVAFLESLGVPGERLSVSAQGALPKGQADRVRFVIR